MTEFIQFLVDIQPDPDKMTHLFYGALLTIFLKITTKNTGIFAIFLLSLAKETLDLYFLTHMFDVGDILYSILPSIVLYFLLKYNKIKQ